MKKVVLFITFLLFSFVTFSQSRLGYTAEQIKAEFWESSYNLMSSHDSSGNLYTAIKTNNAFVFYYFNSDNKCIVTFVVPDNQGALNTFVEMYNSRYVILGPTRWKMYSSGGVADIKLVVKEDGRFYFMWTSAN